MGLTVVGGPGTLAQVNWSRLLLLRRVSKCEDSMSDFNRMRGGKSVVRSGGVICLEKSRQVCLLSCFLWR